MTLLLPFVSVVPGQSVIYDIQAALDSFADVGTSLDIEVRPGFAYGCDNDDNYATDPSIVGTFAPFSLTPTVFSISKNYL